MRASRSAIDVAAAGAAELENEAEDPDIIGSGSHTTGRDGEQSSTPPWERSVDLFNVARGLLVDFEDRLGALPMSEWIQRFSEIWKQLEQLGWSCRSSDTREKIAPGTRVSVAPGYSGVPGREAEINSTHQPGQPRSFNVGDRSGIRQCHLALAGVVRHRHKDGTYEIRFLTGESATVQRQYLTEVSELENTTSGNAHETDGAAVRCRDLKLYEAVRIKLSGWTRWYAGEIVARKARPAG